MKIFIALLLVATVTLAQKFGEQKEHKECNCACTREERLKEYYNNQARTTLNSLRALDDEAIKGFCANLENGNYNHPTGCHIYVACSNHIAYTMPCPAGLHFNHVLNKCVEPSKSHCLMLAGHTTFSAKGKKPGRISLAELPSGLITQIRLEHVSGFVTCSQNAPKSSWGCNNKRPYTYTEEVIGTLITDKENTKIFEQRTMPGFTGNSLFITFNSATNELGSPAFHTDDLTDQELLIWYDEDFNGQSTNDNSGDHAINVYVTMDTDDDEALATRQSAKKTKTVKENIPLDTECVGRPNGNYIHPYQCELYIACSNQNAYVMECPEGLHYNAKMDQCDLPQNLDCQTFIKQVTFAAKGNKPGIIRIDNNIQGKITQVRLDYVSGFVKCSSNSQPSKWGCNNAPTSNFPSEVIGVQITDKNQVPVFKEDRIPGKTGNSPSIIFNAYRNQVNDARPVEIEALPERVLQIWYTEDMGNGDSEHDNSGEVTCNVFVSVE